MSAIRTVAAARYVTPLREGGSLPAIVEADDDGMYVVKFRGAGQGPKALVAELVVAELARAAGLPVPEIVFMRIDPELARTEPDAEIQDLVRASAGLNVALDYLPGAVTFDPVALRPDASLASTVVWLDALVSNLDRTPRNANLLVWHRSLWLIDHGAALYFHHGDGDWRARSREPFALIREHVLLPFADALADADDVLARRLSAQTVEAIVALIPDEWLVGTLDGNAPEDAEAQAAVPARLREAYRHYLLDRLEPPRPFLQEALRAHAAAAVHV